ncbi:MAG TPA: transposase [Tepidimicrobium sp.]|nr:transposase [Tepidimicrobium sp.]
MTYIKDDGKVLFCYSEGIFSCRDIEKMCRYNLRVIYLLDGQPAPNYSTINRFRNHPQPISENILDQFINILLKMNTLIYHKQGDYYECKKSKETTEAKR